MYKVIKKNKRKKVSKHMPHSCFHGIRSSYAHAYTPNVVTYIYICGGDATRESCETYNRQSCIERH